MKRLTRIIAACITVSLLVLSSVFVSFASQLDPQIEAYLADCGKQKVESFFQYSDAELEEDIAYCEAYGDTFSAEVLRSVKDTRAQYGAFQSTGAPSVTQNPDGTFVVSIPVVLEKGTCNALMVISSDMSIFTELSFENKPAEEKQSVGQLIKEASVNLVVGMGTVFAVLIFLCWVISLFKYIHKAEEKIKNKKETKADAPAPVVSVQQVSGDTQSEDEIRAVIAAAIAAYEADEKGSIVKQEALANGKNIRTYRR